MSRAAADGRSSPLSRRLVVLSEGSQLMIIEKNRLRLLREVQNFLDEPLE